MDLKEVEKQLNLTLPSPLEVVKFNDHTFFIKRDDLIHPVISGNKWRKLFFHLERYFKNGFEHVVSFGGAYSNHLYALSHVCAVLKIPLTAFVRGDGFDANNLTLSKIKEDGTHLVFLDRTTYRLKEKAELVKIFIKENPNIMIVPEGGGGTMGKNGIVNLCHEIQWNDFDHIFVSAGTGITAAGLYEYIFNNNLRVKLHVVSALKGSFMRDEIHKYLTVQGDERLQVYNEYHFGGYGKMPEELKDFQFRFKEQTGIPLDLVYNSKTMFALLDILDSGQISPEQRVLYINTGGLRL